MPGPSLGTVDYGGGGNLRQVLKFGGNTIPIIGGTAGWIDLNDAISWFAQTVDIQDMRMLTLSQMRQKARGIFISSDFEPIIMKIGMIYDEGGGTPFQQAKAQLMQLGEQYITFDNSTAILANLQTFASSDGSKLDEKSTPPYRWIIKMEFLCREPWLKDLTPTTQTQALSGATTFNVTYNGAVWAEPVYTITGITGATQLVIANNTSTESLTVFFRASLPSGMTITVDTIKGRVLDQNFVEYDIFGSFPFLYPPYGTANSFTVTATGASGGSILTTYSNRWAV